MAQKLLNICVFALAILVAAPAFAEDFKSEVHLTFQYHDVAGSPDFQPFFYPVLGFSIRDKYVDVQVDSMMPMVIADGMISLINLAAGGEGLVMFEGLNGNTDPGRMPLIDGRARFNFLREPGFKLGVGAGIEYVWFGPYVGKRMTLTSVNLDVHAAMSVDFDDSDSDMIWIVRAGNGWTEYSSFAPILATSFQLRTRLYRALSGLIKLNAGTQYFDTTSWTEPYINSGIDPNGARFTEWFQFWGFEAGISVEF